MSPRQYNVTSSEVERSQSLYKTVEISPLRIASVEMTIVLSPRAKSRGLNHYIWTVEISPLRIASVEMTLVLSPRAKSRGLNPYI